MVSNQLDLRIRALLLSSFLAQVIHLRAPFHRWHATFMSFLELVLTPFPCWSQILSSIWLLVLVSSPLCPILVPHYEMLCILNGDFVGADLHLSSKARLARLAQPRHTLSTHHDMTDSRET